MGDSVSKHGLKAVNSHSGCKSQLTASPIRRGAETATTIPRLELAFGWGIVALQLTICEPCFGTRAMFQEDKDMADQNEAKTKTIGFLPLERVQTLKGWDEYLDKSTKLSVLRTETQKAKNSVRDALKERMNEADDIDFVVEGDRIRVFRVFRKQQQARRTKSLDLSSSFCKDQSEATGISGDEPPPNLDPVTDRLMALMREKGLL